MTLPPPRPGVAVAAATITTGIHIAMANTMDMITITTRQRSGTHWAAANMELQTRALAMTLETAFPGRVRVEYINVLQDPRGPSLPQTALLCSLAYPTPLVYIAGQGRFAGALPVERIRDEVGKLLGN